MLNLLIIEDEPAYVDALEVSLSREGHQLAAATDGKAGLEQFRAERPDLVLLDLMLPGMSGLDVLRKIRSDSDVPVIVLSAKDSESDIVTALELGADDYLTKPYSVRELMARIRVAMRRASADAGETVLMLTRVWPAFIPASRPSGPSRIASMASGPASINMITSDASATAFGFGAALAPASVRGAAFSLERLKTVS